MKSIIVALLVYLSPSLIQASHILPYHVNWKTTSVVGNITIKSTYVLKKKEIKKIVKIYNRSRLLFFNNFEDIVCDSDNFDNLEIRIVSPNILRNKKYFNSAGPYDFGRYFPKSNTLYIIHNMFNQPEQLAHELAHYFYDECKIKFKDNSDQHIKVYGFQDFYKRRRNKERSY